MSEDVSLRDYFAAMALQGFMANSQTPRLFRLDHDAQYAYAIADAMLRERGVVRFATKERDDV